MKKYKTDMMKLITILIITPLMVMAYTRIEKTVSPNTIERNMEEIKAATPVSLGLVGTEKVTPSTPLNNNDFILVGLATGTARPQLIEKGSFENGFPYHRFAVILL